MVPTQKMSEEVFAFSAADRADSQGPQGGQRTFDRGLVHDGNFPDPTMQDCVVEHLAARGGQFNVTGPVQSQHQSTAYHVPQCAVGLDPVPQLANNSAQNPDVPKTPNEASVTAARK